MPWLLILLAVAFGIGLISGLGPATRAAQMSVVDGLRKVQELWHVVHVVDTVRETEDVDVVTRGEVPDLVECRDLVAAIGRERHAVCNRGGRR